MMLKVVELNQNPGFGRAPNSQVWATNACAPSPPHLSEH